ncbi:glycosyltransferase family 2 protein [Fibrella forsythiae]|uniref:Glycosyltransferase n=1 Tax=Fibrella forsythiae TaxID=2817061 RepID=A0ABS3JLU0_9BACT|nr:glycosyltransferase [Fibrella forsythiae]MBO0950975.1 glycosyltransferase [Fibrella forsythiae]
MTPLISVIIPTYHRPELLRKCLDALAMQTLSPEQFEILVVDDGDQPQTALAVRKAMQETGLAIRYLAQPERRGPAAARNRGWRVAIGALIAFTDDDCVPDPNWLSAGLAGFNGGSSVLTGQLTMPLPENPTAHERTTALLEKAEFMTANLFCRRSVLEEVGGFDEAFDSPWREDRELQFKLLRIGVPITPWPTALIVHPMRPAPWYASLRDERKSRYDALLYRKHPDLFRQRIPTYSTLVRRHYLTVSAAMVSVMAALAGQGTMVSAGVTCWLLLTIMLVVDQLSGQRLSWKAMGHALVVGIATPFLAVYWRLYGAVKYRALYL